LTNFFDKARLTSDSEMQRIWSAILSGEANTPGTFSKRTVNMLASLEKTDAEQFQLLCRFNWHVGQLGDWPILFDTKSGTPRNCGLTWSVLRHLDEIGLITYEGLSGAVINGEPLNKSQWFRSLIPLGYRDRNFLVYPGEGTQLGLGKVKLSRAGIDLARICEAGGPVPGYCEEVLEHWRAAGAKVIELKEGTQITPAVFGIE